MKMHEMAEIEGHFKGSIATESARDLRVLDVDRVSGNVLFMTSSIQRGHTVAIYNVEKKTVTPLTVTKINLWTICRHDAVRSMLSPPNSSTVFEAVC